MTSLMYIQHIGPGPHWNDTRNKQTGTIRIVFSLFTSSLFTSKIIPVQKRNNAHANVVATNIVFLPKNERIGDAVIAAIKFTEANTVVT
jgi:hypothetical protein